MQALRDILKGKWLASPGGRRADMYIENAQATAEAFNTLACSIGAGTTERYVFGVEDGKFVPVVGG